MSSVIFTKKRKLDEYCVFGFVRTNCLIQIPNDVQFMCFRFYYEEYVILKFSKEYMNNNAYQLSQDNTLATRKINRDTSYRWILPDIEPVYSGIHCWRAYV